MKIVSLLYLFLLFPFFEPDYFIGVGSNINYIYSFFQLISIFIVFAIFIIDLKGKKGSPIILWIILYNLFLLFSTFLNSNGNLLTNIYNSIEMIALCILIEHGVRNNLKVLMQSLLIIFFIQIFINLLTMFFYPNGMWISPVTRYWQNWFLGYDNNHIIILLPYIILYYIYSQIYHNKLKFPFYFSLILVNTTVLKSWSATSLVGIFSFDIYIFFPKLFKSKIFQFFNLIKGYIIGFFAIVVFRFQNLFSFIIEDVLKKDLTFSARTYIWDYIMRYIRNKPIFGYGIQSSTVRFNLVKSVPSFHAHNLILEIFYRGGVVLVFIFSYIVILVGKQLKKYKDNPLAKFIGWNMFIYAIMLLVEFYEPKHYMYLLVIFYNINYLRGVSSNG